MDVRLPDGTVIQNVPDGTTKADLVAKLKGNGMAVPSEWLDAAPKPVERSGVQQLGDALKDIPRQVGLTARYGIEGLAGIGDIVHEPVRAGMNYVADKIRSPQITDLVTGKPAPLFNKSLSQMGSGLADSIGLPAPQNATERVVGDASRMMVGAAGGMGLAKGIGGLVASPVTRGVLEQVASNPVQQAVSAAGAGVAGGSVREAGGGPGAQFAASLIGGLAAPAVGNAAANAGRNLTARLTPKTSQLADADAQLSLIFKSQGVDWNTIAPQLKNQLRQEAADALVTGGQLDPDAVRRLATFANVPGTRPTVGMLNQNPVQITRERNLAKVGANSSDIGLQTLPNLEGQNVNALLRNLDEAGAANAPRGPDAAARVIGSLGSKVDQAQGKINALYSAARDTEGRSLPLEGGTFTKNANALLDQAMVGGALPSGVQNTMNKIATGEIPLTVEIAEQVKTQLGKLQRSSSDGQQRYALGLVRQALDDTPLQGAAKANPGNLPAIPSEVPTSTLIGEDSIKAFNTARTANREWMQRVEGNPALKAVVEGVEPDLFMKRYLIGEQASAADVRALRDELTPQAVDTVRSYIAGHLKRAANGGRDDINTFASKSYQNALDKLSDGKLQAFFSKDEIKRLKDIGDAGMYMQSQPAGTAVNNSNSGALAVAKSLDFLDKIAGKVPFGDVLIQGNIRGIQQRQALNPKNALLQQAPKPQRVVPNALLLAPSALTSNDE